MNHKNLILLAKRIGYAEGVLKAVHASIETDEHISLQAVDDAILELEGCQNLIQKEMDND